MLQTKITAQELELYSKTFLFFFLLDVKFDLEPRKQLSTIANGTSNEKNSAPAEISIQTQPSKEWELDVRGLVSTKKWLQNYGLKKNRMDIHNILPQIGFKHSDGKHLLITVALWRVGRGVDGVASSLYY